MHDTIRSDPNDTAASETGTAPERGRRRHVTSAATRIKIIEAAEKLFADRGIDGVALREIAAAAGQGNNTAVQYHFGTKEALVYAIFDYRIEMFEPLRAAMLDRAEEAGLLGDARTLLEIMCLPHLTISDENGRHPYSAFLAQYLTRTRAEGIPHPYDDPEVPVPALRRVRRLIVERVNYVPPVELRLRVGLCKLMFLNMLMRRDSGFPHFDQGITLDALVDDTMVQMTVALTAPYNHRHAPLFADMIKAD
ncbi:helix-turn-helix domain-containing protein [Novosphingobium resinovorum]|uniref:TetR/AcrR family transcriptional regulator n=1 Tax=Novosphingobium TaxID=165696 RepID=UPI001B3C5F2B|nr:MULTISPECIES: helix-turn-helix domain-containing protein [Novosphingobium]MBF7014734.1 helix-turn-helix transcriptional regulator [Novosphingobium sp. HR1a]WJM24784.1 helix-turn-helix domain-containing protein [Novosphingobium resinovorum]